MNGRAESNARGNCRPGAVAGQRSDAALRRPRVQALCAALLSLHLKPGGFCNPNLRETVAPLLDGYGQGGRPMGKVPDPNVRCLLVTADAGRSNDHRNRLWKLELQRFADDARWSWRPHPTLKLPR